jgi:hypothetical protein
MMLAAIEAMTEADPVWESRRHNSDIAAQAAAGESVHAASPPKSSGQIRYNKQPWHCKAAAGAVSSGSPTAAAIRIATDRDFDQALTRPG